MTDNEKKEIQSATFERLLQHLDQRKDAQNKAIEAMNKADSNCKAGTGCC